MGIPALWDVLKPGFDQRISIDQLVDHYLNQYDRTPRIAVDAYMFIYESGNSNIVNVDDVEGIMISNFMSKILALISLNISVIVVFDGTLKPKKTRNGDVPTNGADYEQEISKLETCTNFDERNPKIYELKRILLANRIDYVQAAGEAEAQCAFLQNLGIVDYVISNDVDTLVFGATKVLRNFSRIEQEEFQSPKRRSTAKAATSYYVTPVDMSKVEKLTGMTRARLVFLATIRGGDYSTGLDRIGIKMATSLALCGTKFSKYHTRTIYKQEIKEQKKNGGIVVIQEPPPDFANELIRCFVSENTCSLIKSWESRIESSIRRNKLKAFSHSLNEIVREQPRDVFGTAHKFDSNFIFDEYITMLYLFPLVNTNCHIFLPNTLNFGEFTSDPILKVPSNAFFKTIVGSECVRRQSNIENLDYFQELFFSNTTPIAISDIMSCGELPKSPVESLPVPETYRFNIKHIICRLIANYAFDTKSSFLIKITNIKDEDGMEKCMLKYDLKAVCGLFPQSIEAKKLNDPECQSPIKEKELPYIWIPKSIISHYAPKMIDSFIRSREEYEYTKKHKASPQKNKLDSYFTISPTKPIAPPVLKKGSIPYSISKGLPSPKRKKSRPIPPGQKQLDFFIAKTSEVKNRKKESENPFLEKPEVPKINLIMTAPDLRHVESPKKQQKVIKPIEVIEIDSCSDLSEIIE
ncbi:uncharacterized protein J8A68_004429 [[Candida] subhashii]|uniref:XPG-I domain-containing protein n=1 Tax=[Candida] subhashii TaxID=561895 RepID=A0A8J5UKI8_9ASCO|nr:uncharacterized protein J8A68_004429 [[Candida] subhashii]KAG7662041.1 hypothetical protein J8A68_004429 [[Candida] subhashii]